MTLDEIHKHYHYNWSEALRHIHVSRASIQNWERDGKIPKHAQRRIESMSGGLFKADLEETNGEK